MFEKKSSGTCKSEELFDRLLNYLEKEFGGGDPIIYEIDLTEEQVVYYREQCTLYDSHFPKEHPNTIDVPSDDATLKKRGKYWDERFLKLALDLHYHPDRLEEAKNFPELKDLVELAESIREHLRDRS